MGVYCTICNQSARPGFPVYNPSGRIGSVVHKGKCPPSPSRKFVGKAKKVKIIRFGNTWDTDL